MSLLNPDLLVAIISTSMKTNVQPPSANPLPSYSLSIVWTEIPSCIIGPGSYICECSPQYAGDGYTCGLDSDLDGYPDESLNCNVTVCVSDNCPDIPNPSQVDVYLKFAPLLNSTQYKIYHLL